MPNANGFDYARAAGDTTVVGSYRNWVALDCANAHAGHQQLPAAAGIETVTLDFEPTLVIVQSMGHHEIGPGQSKAILDIGAMTADDQWALSFFADNGSNTRACVAKNDKCLTSLFGNVVEFEAELDSFIPTGFRLNQTLAAANPREFWWLACDPADVQIGTTLSRSGTGTQQVATDFVPDTVILVATESQTLGSIFTSGAFIAVGSADAEGQNCAWAARSFNDHWNSSRYDNDKCLTWAIDASGPGNSGAQIISQAELQSFDATPGFTLNFTTQDGTQRYFHWIALKRGDSGRTQFPGAAGTFFQPTKVHPRGLLTYGDSQTTENAWVFGASYGVGVAACGFNGFSGSFQCVDASSPAGSRYAVRDSEEQPFGCFAHKSVAGSADTQLVNRMTFLECYEEQLAAGFITRYRFATP